MNRSTSVFLDGLRVFAALWVFAHHCGLLFFSYLGLRGHAAVVIFFVLSGYVITFSTLSRQNVKAKQYAIARLSRLYSVVIPALVLSALMALLGFAFSPAFYEIVIRGHEGFRYAATAFFLQAIWGWNLVPGDNGPFWSLSYEFWYYVLFGLVVFARGWKWKVGLSLAVALLVGPSILLLMPIWLLGVGLYLYRDRFRLAPAPATVVFIVAMLLCVGFTVMVPDYPANAGAPPLIYASAFLTDWLFGLGVTVIIWSFDQAWGTLAVKTAFENAIRWAANHTFSLYLFHYPLILFVSSLGFFHADIGWQLLLAVVVILGVVIALSEFTETKRKLFQKAVAGIWDRIEHFPARKEAASEL